MRWMLIRHLLLAPAGDGTGGDAGGGGGDPKPLTEEDVGKFVNAAVTSQLKRLLPQAVTEAFSALKLEDKIGEAIAKLKPASDPGGGGDGDKGDKGGKGKVEKDPELQRQFAELNAKLETSEKLRLEAEQKGKDAEQKRQFDNAFGSFKGMLSTKVRAELLDVAAAHFARTEERLKVGDDGSVTLRVKKAPYKGAPEADEHVSLDEGVPLLLASNEAKAFLPAPGGDNNGKKPNFSRQSGGGGGTGPTDPMGKTVAELQKRGIDFNEILD